MHDLIGLILRFYFNSNSLLENESLREHKILNNLTALADPNKTLPLESQCVLSQTKDRLSRSHFRSVIHMFLVQNLRQWMELSLLFTWYNDKEDNNLIERNS